MSAASTPSPTSTTLAEPRAKRTPVPVWMFMLIFALLYWGMVYFDQRGAWFNHQVYTPYHSLAELQKCQPPSGSGNLERGKAVYENVCALCHNTDGSGKPNQAPPFVGSEWVLGSPNRLIRIPLSGLSGPLQVKGQEWGLAMPAMGAALSDDDLAAVLSYMRQSWGNKASAITPEQVKAVKGEIKGRAQPWSASELNAVQ